MKCSDCENELTDKNIGDSEMEICQECLDKYENKTGHCSAACRITDKCDDAC